MEWPAPVLQAQGSLDCTFAAAAYVGRLFGHEASVEAVREWSDDGKRRVPAWYGADVLGLPWTPWRHEGEDRSSWWLGPGARPWVEGWLARGCVGYASVHAGHPRLMHAVVLLAGDAEGVTLMDPMSGFVRWDWPRFLADGAGRGRDPFRVHYVKGWYGPLSR